MVCYDQTVCSSCGIQKIMQCPTTQMMMMTGAALPAARSPLTGIKIIRRLHRVGDQCYQLIHLLCCIYCSGAFQGSVLYFVD